VSDTETDCVSDIGAEADEEGDCVGDGEAELDREAVGEAVLLGDGDGDRAGVMEACEPEGEGVADLVDVMEDVTDALGVLEGDGVMEEADRSPHRYL
jgi:hypothetical protein